MKKTLIYVLIGIALITIIGAGVWDSAYDDQLLVWHNFSDMNDSVNAWNLTLAYGNPWFNGSNYIINNSGNFSGSDAWYINVSDHDAFNFTHPSRNFSISFWIYPMRDHSSNQIIFQKRSANDGWSVIQAINKSLGFYLGTGTAVEEVYTKSLLTIDSWTHIVLIHNDSHEVIYINGEVDKAQANVTLTADPSSNLTIGSDDDGSDWYLGRLDEIGIWNRTITATEVTFLYDSGKGMSRDNDYFINVSLDYPYNNSNFTKNDLFFNVTCTAHGSYNCTLWGNWSGDWHPNASNSSMLNGTAYNFSRDIPDGHYIWNVNCSDIYHDNAFNLTNHTFTVDTTPPHVNITTPTGTTASKTVSFQANATDFNNMTQCIYNVTRGASLEVSSTGINCSNMTGQFTVSSNADYLFHIWTSDDFGNTNFTNSSFTISASGEPGGGGGGGVIIIGNETVILEVGAICEPYTPILEQAWSDFQNKPTWTTFKELWYAFWDLEICASVSSIIPI